MRITSKPRNVTAVEEEAGRQSTSVYNDCSVNAIPPLIGENLTRVHYIGFNWNHQICIPGYCAENHMVSTTTR